jgi:hypothetical protein
LKSGSLNLLEPSGPVQACNEVVRSRRSRRRRRRRRSRRRRRRRRRRRDVCIHVLCSVSGNDKPLKVKSKLSMSKSRRHAAEWKYSSSHS